MSSGQEASPSDGDDVERHPCPRCKADPGSPCCSRSGAVAGTYHTGRFTKVPRLAKLLRVPTPADRGPGQPWRPGTPVPLALAPDAPTADIRIGYARCSTLTQELQSQLDALAKHGIPRDKVFSEKISTRVRVRPQFEAALALARQIKAHAPHCRVVFTVYEMKRLGRDAAELTAPHAQAAAAYRPPSARPRAGRPARIGRAPTSTSWRSRPGSPPPSPKRPVPSLRSSPAPGRSAAFARPARDLGDWGRKCPVCLWCLGGWEPVLPGRCMVAQPSHAPGPRVADDHQITERIRWSERDHAHTAANHKTFAAALH
ncbi:recombinase family protein [Streptomyces sp. NPDC056159]|uniref:recombinase family protein n=1 Tax=Streptomyces sp. NPDC056159 TaxID=3155537 RepID=UPI00341A6DF4